MILKRCNHGHYYDGEKYDKCPECGGLLGIDPGFGVSGGFDGDYADEDSVTVALPRNHEPQRQSHGRGMDDDDVTVALSHNPPVKQGFKPVVGWLVCIRGKDFGSGFSLKLGKNHIGRSPDMEICLQADESVAMNNHAVIYYVPKQRRFAVEAGVSGKRLFLNRNALMRPVWIKQHDILTLGNVSLMFFPCCGEHFSWEELIRKRRERQQGSV